MSVTVVAPPGPVINADDRGRRILPNAMPTHHPQQRVIAHIGIEPRRERDAAGRPPSAIVRQCTTSLSRVVPLPRPRLDDTSGLVRLEDQAFAGGFGVAEEASAPAKSAQPLACPGQRAGRLRFALYRLCRSRARTLEPKDGHRQMAATAHIHLHGSDSPSESSQIGAAISSFLSPDGIFGRPPRSHSWLRRCASG